MKDSASNLEWDYRLPRSRILRGRENIQRLFLKGRKLKERHVDLRYLIFHDQPGICQMGFITGKRLGKAHERNLVKRRMKEAYRLNQHLILDAVKFGEIGFHGILVAKNSRTSFQILNEECIRLLTLVRDQLQHPHLQQGGAS
ncbi:MAG: ribonuclease P protein component [Balneolales bacterium]